MDCYADGGRGYCHIDSHIETICRACHNTAHKTPDYRRYREEKLAAAHMKEIKQAQ